MRSRLLCTCIGMQQVKRHAWSGAQQGSTGCHPRHGCAQAGASACCARRIVRLDVPHLGTLFSPCQRSAVVCRTCRVRGLCAAFKRTGEQACPGQLASPAGCQPPACKAGQGRVTGTHRLLDCRAEPCAQHKAEEPKGGSREQPAEGAAAAARGAWPRKCHGSSSRLPKASRQDLYDFHRVVKPLGQVAEAGQQRR